MKTMNLVKTALLCICAMIVACAHQETKDDHLDSAYEIVVYEDRVKFVGAMNADSLAELKETLTLGHHKELEISSQGGEVIPSIKFGHFLIDADIKVTITDLCASSCANYILPIAHEVVVARGTLLVWHGGAESDYGDSNSSANKVEFREAERALYQRSKTCWALAVKPSPILVPWYSAFTTFDGWTWDHSSILTLTNNRIRFEDSHPVTENDLVSPAPKVVVVNFDNSSCPLGVSDLDIGNWSIIRPSPAVDGSK